MNIAYRKLSGGGYIPICQKLMAKIWGMSDLDVMSGVTLASLLADDSMGVVSGAFDGEKAVGLFIILPTLKPGVVYGHMVGVLDGYRGGAGAGLMRHGFEQAVVMGAEIMTGVSEPLESRNAALYLNKLGARAVRYMEEYFHMDCDMHRGLPMDRLSLRFPLNTAPSETSGSDIPTDAETALDLFPVAQNGHMPEAGNVLAEIPFGLADVKSADPNAARRWRFSVRDILSEYLNRRGYSARRLYAGNIRGEMRSFYLLSDQPSD